MSEDLRVDYNDEGLYAPDDFTGVWEVYWPNLKLKFRGDFVNGKEHGRQSYWWDNGRLAQTGMSQCGECCGVWVDYLSDGMKFKETEYREPGHFTVRYFNRDGSIDEVIEWVNGVEQNQEE